MDLIKTLASMEIGEQGHIIQILGDQQVYHKLVNLGLEVGIPVAVVGRKRVGITQVPSIFVQVGSKNIVLLDTEASKVIVKVKTLRPISSWERPEPWNPTWPFFPHWGVYQ